MTTIDKAYVEKLGEVLFDEKKAINYKTVSVMLGVHVNIAKQMLYHLHKAANEEKKKLYPTYYISGMMPREKIMALQKKQSDETTDTLGGAKQLSGGDIDAYLVTLCREKGLEELKAKFTKIFSIHMYSLSAFPIENYDVLNNLVEFPLRGSDGHTPVDFGPITCSASQKLLANARPVPVPVVNDVSKAKSEAKNEVVKKSDNVKESGKDFFKSSSTNGSKNEEPSKNGIVESASQKVAKPAPPEKKDRLKSMFAAAATKPKTQKAEKPETKKSDTSSDKKPKAQENKDKGPSSEKSKNSRKRKRIRDVLSSDSEGEEKNSEDDEDSAPESPVQRKRIQIDSDSDDDVKETRTKTPEPEESKEVKTVVPAGRKRVAKMISKSYLDKDGFLVTTKEQVMVSEDEDDEKCKSKLVKEEQRKPNVESKTVNGSSKSPSEKPSAKSTTSKNAPGKTKQASLMSFFQKK